MNRRWIVLGVVIWLTATTVATVCSTTYQRPYQGIVGNLCDRTTQNPHGYCYQALPAGGFPLPYLYDSPSTSVIGKLGMEDVAEFQNTIHAKPLLVDFAAYAALFALAFVCIRRLFKRARSSPVRG